MTVDEILNLEKSILIRYYFYDDELYSTAKNGISRERFIETKDSYISSKLKKVLGYNDKKYDKVLDKFFTYMPGISWKKDNVDRILSLDSLGMCYVYLNEARCLNMMSELNEIVSDWETIKMDNPEYRDECNKELAIKTRDIIREKRKQVNTCNSLKEFKEVYRNDDDMDQMVEQMVKQYTSLKYTRAQAETIVLETLKTSFNDEMTFLCSTIKNAVKICPIEYSEEIKKMINPIKLGLLLAFKSMDASLKSSKDEDETEMQENFNLCGIYAYWFYKYLKENKEVYEKNKHQKIRIFRDRERKYAEYTLEDFLPIFEKFYKENMSKKRMLDRQIDSAGISFKEFETRFNERLERDKKKLRLEVAATDWEIIRAGTIDREREDMLRIIDDMNYQRRKNKPKTLDEIEKQQQEKLKLLMDKWEFFDQSNYIVTIKGTNQMSGYIGYIYPNGTVVFEQFFEEKKEREPVIYKAIYVMDILNFIKMSSLSKTEIMEYIKKSQDESVKRVYHSKNWKEKIIQIIKANTLTKEKKEALKDFLGLLEYKNNDNKVRLTKIELENFSENMKLKENRTGIVIGKEEQEEQQKVKKIEE